MTVYYDNWRGDLLTEEEAVERMKTYIEENDLHLDALADRMRDCPSEVWNMLTEEAKSAILDEIHKDFMEEHFLSRDF